MGIVRLHITPLAVETRHSFLPPKVLTVRAAVASMSFHAVKCYGYLDCERDVADRIRKKMNRNLIRGVRVRVEDARPDTLGPRGVSNGEGFEGEKEKRKRAKGDADGDRKKAKNSREKGVVDGIGL